MGTISLTCSSCDSSHPDVALKEYRGTPPGLATHWYECPNTGDAVPVTVRAVKGKHEALNSVLMDRLGLAYECGQNLVYIFHLSPDDPTELMMHSVPHGFETRHMQAVMDLVRQQTMEAIGAPDGPPMEAVSVPAAQDEPFARLFKGRSNGE